jgi:hypothetical protein
MRTRYGMAMMAAAGLSLLASQVAAQFPPVTDPNAAEAKCAKTAGKALTKFVGAKAKCGLKCLVAARKIPGPYGGCFSPYSDPTTQACIYDSLKGAASKARASITKACDVAIKPTNDCPECYTSQSATLCSTGDPFVQNADNQTNGFAQLVFCLENGGTTPTAEQAKCEDGTSKALVKFVGAKSKCYTKCNQNVLKGKIAQGSCDPPSPTDPATNACIFDPLKGAEAKAAAAIDKVCANVPTATPPCYGTGLDTGAEWVSITESAVDGNIPNIACGA